MNFLFKPYSIMFFSTLNMGIIISLTSSNWLSIWIGLELNLYSLIPIIMQSQSNQEKEAAIKYFLIQALASMILLTASMAHQNEGTPLLFMISLLMKLGMAPCHFWLPIVMNSLSWNLCWILSTTQKITPMLLIINIMHNNTSSFIMSIAIMNGLIGGIGGINQTQMRAILAYSSIGHMGWMTGASLASPNTAMAYLAAYIIIISATIQPLKQTSIFISSYNMPNYCNYKLIKMSFIMNLLSLGGLPPLFGFFPKMFVIMSMTQMGFMIMPLLLIISSTINLYYYLKIMTPMFFSNKKYFTSPMPMKQNLPMTLFLTFSTMSSLTIFIVMM